MCLDTVDKEIKVKEGIGWKCFQGRDDANLTGLVFASPQPAGRWLKDKNKKKIRLFCSDETYPAGFHILTHKKAARQWLSDCTRMVRYRKVVATGTQNGYDAIVAREIRIFTAKEAKEYEKK